MTAHKKIHAISWCSNSVWSRMKLWIQVFPYDFWMNIQAHAFTTKSSHDCLLLFQNIILLIEFESNCSSNIAITPAQEPYSSIFNWTWFKRYLSRIISISVCALLFVCFVVCLAYVYNMNRISFWTTTKNSCEQFEIQILWGNSSSTHFNCKHFSAWLFCIWFCLANNGK